MVGEPGFGTRESGWERDDTKTKKKNPNEEYVHILRGEGGGGGGSESYANIKRRR